MDSSMSKNMSDSMGSGHSGQSGHGSHADSGHGSHADSGHGSHADSGHGSHAGSGMHENMTHVGHGAHNSTAAAKDEHSGHSMGHAMSPFLFGDRRDFFVLFKEARITTAGSLTAALIVTFLFATLATMFSEFSKIVEGRASKSQKRLTGILVFSTITFAFRVLLHYVAMLLIMGMNIYVIIAVVAGHAAGYFVFRLLKKADPEANDEHCI